MRLDPLAKLTLARVKVRKSPLEHLGGLEDLQGRQVGSPELQRNEGPFARVLRERQRLLQVVDARRGRQGGDLGGRQVEQQLGTRRARERLDERALEVGGRDVGRATRDGGARRLAEHLDSPRLFERRCRKQVYRNTVHVGFLLRQQPRYAPVSPCAISGREARVDRRPD